MTEIIALIVLCVIYGLLGIALLYGILILIKNEVTYKNLNIISDAIFAYTMDRIDQYDYDYQVSWSDMKSYDEALYCLWDWGYEHILPPDKFEVVKPYIGKKEK